MTDKRQITKHFRNYISKLPIEELKKVRVEVHKKRYEYLFRGIGSGRFRLSRDSEYVLSYDTVQQMVRQELKNRGNSNAISKRKYL